MQKEAGTKWSNSDLNSIAHKRCAHLRFATHAHCSMPLADYHILQAICQPHAITYAERTCVRCVLRLRVDHCLVASKFGLCTCFQELRRSLAALNIARQGIQERDFLIATHERSEHALANHANSLCSDMDGAAQEMTALFDRYAAPKASFCCTPSALHSLSGHVHPAQQS